MTAPGGGDYGEQYRAHPGQPRPWEQYPHPPVDPQEPVNYPEFAPPYPPQPPYPAQPPPGPGYGYPPLPPGAPIGYGGPPPYPAPYDPYQVYQASSYQTNGLAIASLITSIAGVVLGIPLAFFCYLGLLIPVVGAVLGAVALSQIRRTHQPGRGMAIAGIVIGCLTVVALLLLALFMLTAAALHAPVI
jgi:Domain of unknown function (DUF4190)